MIKILYSIILVNLLILSESASAQTANPVFSMLPCGTLMYENVQYAGDTLLRHQLDIYTPPARKSSYPVVVWIHGGGWRKGDKFSASDFMARTIYEMISKGYAIVSINYRYSSTDKFPAQIQDCNDALRFISQNNHKYHLNKESIALMGFSAGGHLAALLGLSNNNKVSSFYSDQQVLPFKIRLVIDYYGISDLETLTGPGTTDPKTGVQLLLGGKASELPGKAKAASPVSYIDQKDPPFFIVHGDADQAVSDTQSTELSNRLTLSGVKNKLIIIAGAPHGGELFDTQPIRKTLFSLLKVYLK